MFKPCCGYIRRQPSNGHARRVLGTVFVSTAVHFWQGKTSQKLTKGQLELGLNGLRAHLLDLGGKHLGRGRSAVDTVGLDGDENTAANLEEPVGVHGNDTGLVRLGNVGKDDIDHGDNHAVAGGLTGILNNGDNVGALGSHGNQITARARRELDGVDVAGRADEVSNVGDRSTRGSTEVQHARARLHVEFVGTTSDGSAQLASERVPHAVLDLGGRRGTVVVLDRLVDGYALLAVDGLARGQVAGSNTVLLAATDDEHARVTMGFLKYGSQHLATGQITSPEISRELHLQQ